MSDIAIITFHRACNYGAFLQAYALQETLNGYEGVNAFILDYRSDKIEEIYLPKYCLKRKGNVAKKFFKMLLVYPYICRRNTLFARSREEFYRHKAKNITRQQLSDITKDYDAFITGSDQVWNPDIVDKDKSYFLDFVENPCKKYSYAASIGKTSLSSQEIANLTGLIKDYKRISVREADILPVLRENVNLPEVVCSLDPVFLFNAQQWRKFSVYEKRKPYVLFFMMGQSETAVPALNFAKKLAEKKNLEVVFLSDNERWYKYRDVIHFGAASPAEFVGLIDNAEYVVTNSFHCTAFSIILHKDFFVETAIRRSSRITNLLDITSLKERGLVKGKLSDKPSRINWKNVDNALEPLINNSCKYLEEIISDINERSNLK